MRWKVCEFTNSKYNNEKFLREKKFSGKWWNEVIKDKNRINYYFNEEIMRILQMCACGSKTKK